MIEWLLYSRVRYLILTAAIVVVLMSFFGEQSASLSAWGARMPAAGAAGAAVLRAEARTDASSSIPLTLAGDLGFNVRAALDASGGALREVVIAPGATFSFNATVGSPALVTIVSVGGVPGGGWCDLAARYVQAVRPVLPPEAVRFPNHNITAGFGLADVAYDDAVSIWNIDGRAGSDGGSQDLQIRNVLDRPLRLVASEEDGAVVIRAFVE